MYQIGTFSKLGKVTVKTLRYYDEIGLLEPALIDESSGYRYYTTDQLVKLHRIVALKQLGFSIAEIARLLGNRNRGEIIASRKSQLEAQHRHIADQLARLDHLLSQEGETMNPDYQAVIKDIPEYTVFSKRTILPTYDALFSVMPELGKAVEDLNPNLKCVEPEYCITIYHDGEYQERDIDAEICQAVTRAGIEPEDKDFIFKTLPGATVVSVLHKGPYSSLGEAYAYAMKWIEKNGYTVDDNPRESYIDGIWNKDDESMWLTEVQFPIAK